MQIVDLSFRWWISGIGYLHFQPPSITTFCDLIKRRRYMLVSLLHCARCYSVFYDVKRLFFFFFFTCMFLVSLTKEMYNVSFASYKHEVSGESHAVNYFNGHINHTQAFVELYRWVEKVLSRIWNLLNS